MRESNNHDNIDINHDALSEADKLLTETELKNLAIQNDLNQWTLGTCKVDRRAVMYFSQLAISAVTLGFCMARLSSEDSKKNDENAIYMNIISMIIGIYLPTPSMHW